MGSQASGATEARAQDSAPTGQEIEAGDHGASATPKNEEDSRCELQVATT
jgi:hypothetical protein